MEGNKKIINAFGVGLAVAILAILISSCSAPKTAPYAEPVTMPTEQLEHGRVLFNNKCATCHPEGMSGLGPAIVNKPLPKFFIRFQVRHGLGAMPAFKEDALSDQQVKAIAEYVVYMRKKD
jgi:mono/diheme cytochrome c family protein